MSTESVVSYSAPRGEPDLEDVSYDGVIETTHIHGGLGQLVDGLYGEEDVKGMESGKNACI